jgi:hypothetical protein
MFISKSSFKYKCFLLALKLWNSNYLTFTSAGQEILWFYGMWKFITVFIGAHHWTLYFSSWVHFRPPHSVSIKILFINAWVSHIVSWLVFWLTFYMHLISHACCMFCPPHLPYYITLTMLGEEPKLWSASHYVKSKYSWHLVGHSQFVFLL